MTKHTILFSKIHMTLLFIFSKGHSDEYQRKNKTKQNKPITIAFHIILVQFKISLEL